MKEQIDDWCNGEIAVKSNSGYAIPFVVVKKSNGELLLCVDYHKLNEKTILDPYPIPRVDDSLDAVEGSIIFSCFDFKTAYNQVEINKGDQHKTAFSSPWGLFEFTRMSFGLVNTPATFQRIMSNIFREEIYKFVVCYLDAKSYEEHIRHIGIAGARWKTIILKRL